VAGVWNDLQIIRIAQVCNQLAKGKLIVWQQYNLHKHLVDEH